MVVAEPVDPRPLVALLANTWSTPVDRFQLGPELVRAMSAAGSYVAVAADPSGAVVGASLGFIGFHEGRIDLHSHITAARPSARGGVGYALKMHQRAWALERGIDTIRWTFDPLVRRNAWFNLAKLGARIAEYLPDFYGTMTDGVNAGDKSDRCLAEWQLVGPAAVAAARGERQDVDEATALAAGAVAALAVGEDGGPRRGPSGRVLLCAIPDDILALRASDPDAASSWRSAVRDVLGGALAEGLAVEGITRSGSYVLAPPGRTG